MIRGIRFWWTKSITIVIDWECAQTALEALAFNSPVALLLVLDFYDDANSLGNDETVFAGIFEGKGQLH